MTATCNRTGAQANMAVFLSFEPGDRSGMDLTHGGHLTHGMKLNCRY